VLASCFTIQGSLITLPYAIQRHRPLGTPAEHAGSALAHSGLLAMGLVTFTAASALTLFGGGAHAELVAMTWALAGVAPFALLREFCRRFSFTHLWLGHALLLDLAVATLQLSILGWLGWTGRMSAVTACGALGLSCGLAGFGWLYLARADFAIRADQLRATLAQSWSLGKWLFVNQIMVQVQRYITYWLSMVIAGAAVTGVYAACMSVVSFANPLTFGLGNILTPRSVQAWKEGGAAGLRRQAIRDALLFGAAMAPFCLLVMLAGDDVMRFLYHGSEYEGHGHAVTVLAFAAFAAAIGMPASNALASMERPREIFCVGAIGAALTVVLVWWLMTEWGLLGAAYGLLAGNTVGCAGLWGAFLALVPRAPEPAPAVRVLESLSPSSDPDGWTMTRLGEGDHAHVYAARAKDRQPIWQQHRELVIKLYKPEAALTADMVQAQFDSLARLHAALHGRVVDGWTISTPQPLRICVAPLALVMTAVSGKKDLKSAAAGDDALTPEVLESLGRAFVAAMRDTWGRGQLHGDIGLQNVLYDIPAKSLSFIDPGTRECCRVCNDGTRRWRPAVLELGHILRDLGTDMRDLLGNPIARMRRQIFVASALRAYVATIGKPAEKHRALHDIRACALEHLSKVLAPSWSPRGMCHWLLGQIVVRRMDSLLRRLKAELMAGARPVEKSAPSVPSQSRCVA